MHKNLFAIVHTEKTKAFCVVKPLNGTLCQKNHHLVLFRVAGAPALRLFAEGGNTFGQNASFSFPDPIGEFGSLSLYDIGRLRPFRTIDDVEANRFTFL